MEIMLVIFVIIAAVLVIDLILIRPGNRQSESMEALKKQKYYAHRGLYDNESDHPENSLKAFQNAIDHGFGIEMDVQLSKDGVPVVFHDFQLARTARDSSGKPVQGKVSAYTLAELKSFHLMNSTETIPTFAEFLELVSGQVPLIVELKIENSDTKLAVCPAADAMLSEYQGLYCVESFNPRGVKWYRKHHPEVIRGQLSSMFNRTNEDRRKWWLIYFLTENLMFNFLTKPDFIAYDCRFWKNLPRRICRYLFHNTSVAWTIQSQKELDERQKDFDIFIFEHFVPHG